MPLLTGNGRADFGKSNKSSVKGRKKIITVAGTAEQLDSVAIPAFFQVVVKALATNTDNVHVAESKANAENNNNAYELSAGEAIGYQITNTDLLWIDANVNSEGVTYTVEA